MCVLVECLEYIVLVKKTEVFSILVFSYSLFSQRDLAEIQTPPGGTVGMGCQCRNMVNSDRETQHQARRHRGAGVPAYNGHAGVHEVRQKRRLQF